MSARAPIRMRPADGDVRRITLEVTPQAFDMLARLAGHGIYGRTSAEVAVRMVDRALEPFLNLVCAKCGDPLHCPCEGPRT